MSFLFRDAHYRSFVVVVPLFLFRFFSGITLRLPLPFVRLVVWLSLTKLPLHAVSVRKSLPRSRKCASNIWKHPSRVCAVLIHRSHSCLRNCTCPMCGRTMMQSLASSNSKHNNTQHPTQHPPPPTIIPILPLTPK